MIKNTKSTNIPMLVQNVKYVPDWKISDWKLYSVDGIVANTAFDSNWWEYKI